MDFAISETATLAALLPRSVPRARARARERERERGVSPLSEAKRTSFPMYGKTFLARARDKEHRLAKPNSRTRGNPAPPFPPAPEEFIETLVQKFMSRLCISLSTASKEIHRHGINPVTVLKKEREREGGRRR